MGYSSLTNYYETVFALRQFHNYSDADIMEWLPFERDVYVDMLMAHLEKEKQKNQ